MSWKYYKDGELIEECNDIPETMEDAIMLLEENGIDVSDCVDDKNDTCPHGNHIMSNCSDCDWEEEFCTDFWSPDYPPEEDSLTFAPLTDKEVKDFEEAIKLLEQDIPQLSSDFIDKLHNKIKQETGVDMRPTRLDNIKSWWINVTTGNKIYLAFWIIFFYILTGMIVQDSQMLKSFLEMILWPFV
tara:strand:+ start:483 stop:1040 length:558 start_codon:yes stop_codon:yes gene_type:complete